MTKSLQHSYTRSTVNNNIQRPAKERKTSAGFRNIPMNVASGYNVLKSSKHGLRCDQRSNRFIPLPPPLPPRRYDITPSYIKPNERIKFYTFHGYQMMSTTIPIPNPSFGKDFVTATIVRRNWYEIDGVEIILNILIPDTFVVV